MVDLEQTDYSALGTVPNNSLVVHVHVVLFREVCCSSDIPPDWAVAVYTSCPCWDHVSQMRRNQDLLLQVEDKWEDMRARMRRPMVVEVDRIHSAFLGLRLAKDVAMKHRWVVAFDTPGVHCWTLSANDLDDAHGPRLRDVRTVVPSTLAPHHPSPPARLVPVDIPIVDNWHWPNCSVCCVLIVCVPILEWHRLD